MCMVCIRMVCNASLSPVVYHQKKSSRWRRTSINKIKNTRHVFKVFAVHDIHPTIFTCPHPCVRVYGIFLCFARTLLWIIRHFTGKRSMWQRELSLFLGFRDFTCSIYHFYDCWWARTARQPHKSFTSANHCLHCQTWIPLFECDA